MNAVPTQRCLSGGLGGNKGRSGQSNATRTQQPAEADMRQWQIAQENAAGLWGPRGRPGCCNCRNLQEGSQFFLQSESRWDLFYFIGLFPGNIVVKSRGFPRELEAVDSINTFKREKKWGFCTNFLNSLFFWVTPAPANLGEFLYSSLLDLWNWNLIFTSFLTHPLCSLAIQTWRRSRNNPACLLVNGF